MWDSNLIGWVVLQEEEKSDLSLFLLLFCFFNFDIVLFYLF